MKNKQNNFIHFMFYTTSIISFSIFLIIMLTLKNECRKNEEEILQLPNKYFFAVCGQFACVLQGVADIFNDQITR